MSTTTINKLENQKTMNICFRGCDVDPRVVEYDFYDIKFNFLFLYTYDKSDPIFGANLTEIAYFERVD